MQSSKGPYIGGGRIEKSTSDSADSFGGLRPGWNTGSESIGWNNELPVISTKLFTVRLTSSRSHHRTFIYNSSITYAQFFLQLPSFYLHFSAVNINTSEPHVQRPLSSTLDSHLWQEPSRLAARLHLRRVRRSFRCLRSAWTKEADQRSWEDSELEYCCSLSGMTFLPHSHSRSLLCRISVALGSHSAWSGCFEALLHRGSSFGRNK